MTKVKDKIQAPDLVEQNEAVVYAGDVHPDTEIPASMVHPDPVKMPPLAQPIATSQADRLIELAIQNNADVDRLDKLLELKERYEKEEARKSYTAAMAAFKGEDIVITKDRTVRFPHKDGSGETSYKHRSATLSALQYRGWQRTDLATSGKASAKVIALRSAA